VLGSSASGQLSTVQWLPVATGEPLAFQGLTLVGLVWTNIEL